MVKTKSKSSRGFVNRYLDMMEFMEELQRQLGANVIIAMILENGRLTMMFQFHLIPRLAKVDYYSVKFDPEDFQEPDKNTTRVIVDHVKAYMESGGKGDAVTMEVLAETLGDPN